MRRIAGIIDFEGALKDHKVIKQYWREFESNKLHWSGVWALVIANKWMESAVSP